MTAKKYSTISIDIKKREKITLYAKSIGSTVSQLIENYIDSIDFLYNGVDEDEHTHVSR